MSQRATFRGTILKLFERRPDANSAAADTFDCRRTHSTTPGSNRLQPVHTGKHRATLRWAPPEEHAAAILEALQGPDGQTGTVPYRHLREIHADVCIERNIEPCAWNPVGKELRKLIGGEKTYGYDANGKRIRVYRIPPRDPRSNLRVIPTQNAATSATPTSASANS